jgi:hypothetical protein
MLGASDEVGYIHEPFNIHRGPGMCRMRFPYWFMYIRPGTEGPVAADFRRLLAFHYNYRAQLFSIRSSDDLRALVRDGSRFLRFRMRHARPLLKDPMAVFSAEWIAETFDAQVVVIIRHPAAFASSIKLDGWAHPFSHFVNQPALVEDHLRPFRDEIEAFAHTEHDILEQAALLWRLVHGTIAEYLSRHPLEGFESLYNSLNLPFTGPVREAIQRSTSSSNSADRDPDGRLFLARDSRANVDNWRRRLTPDEVARVHSRVADVSQFFYSEEEW